MFASMRGSRGRGSIPTTSRRSAMHAWEPEKLSIASCITIAPLSVVARFCRFQARENSSSGAANGSGSSPTRTCSRCVRISEVQGYVLNNDKIPYTPGQPLTDADFHPDFEQRGVDMRIGMDIANLSSKSIRGSDCAGTNDTDCIPAMKHARRSGLQPRARFKRPQYPIFDAI